MHPAAVLDNANRLAEEFDIRLTRITDLIATLSGGNAQKVVVARELSRDLRLFRGQSATRGVDRARSSLFTSALSKNATRAPRFFLSHLNSMKSWH